MARTCASSDTSACTSSACRTGRFDEPDGLPRVVLGPRVVDDDVRAAARQVDGHLPSDSDGRARHDRRLARTSIGPSSASYAMQREPIVARYRCWSAAIPRRRLLRAAVKRRLVDCRHHEGTHEGARHQRRQGQPAAPVHVHRRQADGADRQQAHPVLRHRASRRGGHHRHHDRHLARDRRPDPAARPATGRASGRSIDYIVQPQPGGIAQAIGLARERDGAAQPFVAFLGDNFLTHGIVPLRAGVRRIGADDACIMLKQVPDARQFGVAQFEGERLVQVVEKPKEPPSDLAVIGIYMFTPRVFEAIDSIKPSARGELEITDTIQWLLDHGRQRCAPRSSRANGSTPASTTTCCPRTASSSRRCPTTAAAATSTSTVKLHGRVVLQAGCADHQQRHQRPGDHRRAHGDRERLHRPVHVDRPRLPHRRERDRRPRRAGEHARSSTSATASSTSLIGRNVELIGDDRKPRGYQLILGDFSRVRVP